MPRCISRAEARSLVRGREGRSFFVTRTLGFPNKKALANCWYELLVRPDTLKPQSFLGRNAVATFGEASCREPPKLGVVFESSVISRELQIWGYLFGAGRTSHGLLRGGGSTWWLFCCPHSV